MNSFEKIQRLQELLDERTKLENQLASINTSIEEQKGSCLHISVELEYDDQYPSKIDKFRCLLCGKGEVVRLSCDPKYSVHAENYLSQFGFDCDYKFNTIQKMAVGLLKDQPNMSKEELVTKLNNLIQEGISISESQNSPQLVKKGS